MLVVSRAVGVQRGEVLVGAVNTAVTRSLSSSAFVHSEKRILGVFRLDPKRDGEFNAATEPGTSGFRSVPLLTRKEDVGEPYCFCSFRSLRGSDGALTICIT